MNKSEYLKDNEKFVKYLNKCVTGKQWIDHEYTVVWKPWQKWLRGHSSFARDNDYCWRANTLKDAFANYYWPPGSYKENVKELARLSTGLKNESDDKSLFYQCVAVLNWGKVVNGGSINWLLEMVKSGSLQSNLKKGIGLLCGKSEEAVKKAFGKDSGELLMNSGLTKIYSLMSDSSIIYDSRVGAALCLLIRRYLEEYDIKKVPEGLSFQWGEERSKKSGERSKRDPSLEGRYKFRNLSNNSHEHAVLNLRANWLFEAALPEGDLWGFKEKMEKLRALEAGLFMIGYDVTGSCHVAVQQEQKSNKLATNKESEQLLRRQGRRQSKIDCAREVYKELRDNSSSEVRQSIMRRCDCTKKQASTYYYKIKNET